MNFNIPSPIPGTIGSVAGNLIDAAFALAGLIALFYLIIGGYKYITSGGNPEAIDMAKATITNAIIGLVVILVSYLVIGFILARIGASNFASDLLSYYP
jgi:hypothetical protein